jgi:hypothetical protein
MFLPALASPLQKFNKRPDGANTALAAVSTSVVVSAALH